MIINNSYKNNIKPTYAKKIGFSGKLLYTVNIKKIEENGVVSLLPAKIIQLCPKKIADMSKFNQIMQMCEISEKFAQWIRKNFINNTMPIFTLEVKNPLYKLHEKVLGFAQICMNNVHPTRENGENSIELTNLFVAQNSRYTNKNREFKGAGEVLLYGISRLAGELKMKRVTLNSDNDAFYKAVGMPKTSHIDTYCHSFDRNSLNDFLKKVETKYQISALKN